MSNENRNQDRTQQDRSNQDRTQTGGGSSTTTGTSNDVFSTIRYNRSNRSFNFQGQNLPAREALTRWGITETDINDIFSGSGSSTSTNR